MGFLSKLFSDETKKLAKDMLGELAENVSKSSEPQDSYQSNYDQPANTGGYYGKQRPAEENQYNFKGTYVQYFEKVYTEEFPEYRIEHEEENKLKSSVFTFWKDGEKALVVELLSETSARKKLRQECADNNIPYLRFYYNHKGWWNTRNYVVSRTKDALN